MMPKLLTIAAAIAVTADAQSYPKTDDPSRILTAVESIDRRINENRLLRGGKKKTDVEAGSPPFVPTSSGNNDEQRSLSDNDDVNNVVRMKSVDSKLSPQPRIIGGLRVPDDKYPYLASLTYFGQHICGGSLVAKDMILTAAHCAGYATSIELGKYDKTIQYDDDNNPDERIDVAYEIEHPGWNVKTVDNDYMLIKLVEPSVNHPLITLNTDPDFPSIPGEEVTIMGWGDTNEDPDVNEPGLFLAEASLEYVPDDECKAKQGKLSSGDFVNYAQRLTDNMMCAMDQDGAREPGVAVDEDTCTGDSGGPMIIPSEVNGQMVDVQVGIVSWGIGCASQIFPGVYSRVSSQYNWIRENVCCHTSYPRDDFECDKVNCDESGGGFTLEEDTDDPSTYVTIEVSLDEQPEEFSWMVTTLNGYNDQVVATVPPGFYTGYSNYTFHHKIKVGPNRFYKISLRDTFGDGLKGYVAVYRGGRPILSHLIMYERLFTDTKKIDHAFYTGKEPSNYFSLAIQFDKFPKDVWWKLESVNDNVILAQRPPGWYNDRFELMRIVEKIPVFGLRSERPEYRFTIGDSYPCDDDPTQTCGDGICCDYGEGKFELFAGPESIGQLLSTGGDYGLSQTVDVTPPSQSTT